MNATTNLLLQDDTIERPHKRTVRSFVCRNTKLPPVKEQLFETLWPIYGVEAWQNNEHISPKSLFANAAPVVLEIGFGTGDSLFEMAKNYPEQNFMGVEVYRRGIVSLLAKTEAYPLKNLRLFWGDANEVLQRFENASLSRVQIFFPDPWPKSRHHKRRLIQSTFVSQLAPKFIPQGILHLATDWQDYAQHMMKVLLAEPLFKNTQEGSQCAPRPEYRPPTKYERRGTRLGHVTSDLLFKRV